MTSIMKYFDSIMTGQLNQVTNNSRPSNEEACQRRLNRKRLIKLKQTKLKYEPKFRKISVSGLLKEFNQRHTHSAGHPNSATLLDINEICGMYIYFFYFCHKQSSHWEGWTYSLNYMVQCLWQHLKKFAKIERIVWNEINWKNLGRSQSK